MSLCKNFDYEIKFRENFLNSQLNPLINLFHALKKKDEAIEKSPKEFDEFKRNSNIELTVKNFRQSTSSRRRSFMNMFSLSPRNGHKKHMMCSNYILSINFHKLQHTKRK